MLVVVNQPHTSFRIEGDIPASMLAYVDNEYGKQNVSIIDDDGDMLLNPHDMEWFKEAEATETPGKNLRFYRKLAKMTQPELAAKLGTSRQAISNMENGIRPISKKTAKELEKIFRVSVSNFI